MKAKALTRGARAIIKKGGIDGDVLQGLNIPAEGAFVVRSLAPGQYTVVDTCGGWRNFEVLAGQEHAVLLEGAAPGPSGEPGSTGVIETEAAHVGREPVIRAPDQVAAERTITGPETPTKPLGPDSPGVEKSPPVGERSRSRGLAPDEDVRVPGGPGAGFSQEAPIVSAADELHAGEEHPGSSSPIPSEVRMTEGPPPDRDTTLSEGEHVGAEPTPAPFGSPAAGAPLVDGAPKPRVQEPLGRPPAPAKKPARRRAATKKPAAKKPAAKKATAKKVSK